ncbi:MAG TPA: hypothetical protein VFV25_01570, partial [Methylibium sp.]
ASLGYRTETWGANAAVSSVGARPDVDSNFSQVQLPSYAMVDLSAHYAFARQWRFETKLLNAFDKRYEPVKDYGSLGRSFWVGLRYDTLGF